MPELTAQDGTRTRKVKTIIDTVEPIVEKSETGLGMTPLEYVRQLADEQLPLCKLYIYRVDPKTTGSYIDLVSDRLDEQILEERYGGKILAVKLQHKTADGLKEGYQSRIEVLSEPKYTKRELFANPSLAPAPAATPANSGGISEAMLSRLIDKLLEEKLSTQNANASAIESTVKMMETASNRAIDVIAAQVPKNGNSLLETITALKELGLLGQKPGDGGIRETLSLLKELGIVGGEKSQTKTLVEQLKDLTALKEFFGGDEGGGKGSAKTNWLDILQAAIDKSPQLVDRVMLMANENMRRRQAAAAQQAAPPESPAPLPSSTSEQPAVEIMPTENAAPASSGTDPDEPFKKLVVKRIQENADPIIVLNLIEAWNPQVAAMLHAFNREAVRGFIQADSILREALNAPEFEKWFAAFYELIEEDNRDVDEGAEPGSKRVQ